jgi:hypothetical protein
MFEKPPAAATAHEAEEPLEVNTVLLAPIVVKPVPPLAIPSVDALVHAVPVDCKKLPDAPVAGKSDVDHVVPL